MEDPAQLSPPLASPPPSVSGTNDVASPHPSTGPQAHAKDEHDVNSSHAVAASQSQPRASKDEFVEKSPSGVYLKYPELVGKGSFKVVYKAQDLEHGKLVAWNEINIKKLSPKDKRRILNEMTLLKTLQHPCLIEFYSAWVNKEAEKVVFITELMSSGTLRE
jgi:hypothetical protein